jgi:hypothetical protein
MSGIAQHLSFCDWQISLSMESSRSTHVIACQNVLLCKDQPCSTIWMGHIQFIYW